MIPARLSLLRHRHRVRISHSPIWLSPQDHIHDLNSCVLL
uniref:Uncharacterized protein n=1 Tax=Arundo donax TaxID=35708 RepID=A0A0A9AN04_ARUDO